VLVHDAGAKLVNLCDGGRRDKCLPSIRGHGTIRMFEVEVVGEVVLGSHGL
jgi:hypothetical protein